MLIAAAEEIWCILAAVLALGNVEFEGDDSAVRRSCRAPLPLPLTAVSACRSLACVWLSG
jgi:hypothetical protein